MRIVSLLAAGTEIVCALGCERLLVGRSHECDNPPSVLALPECTHPTFDVDQPSGAIDAEVRRRLATGEPLYDIDVARIRALDPDLLIAQVHCDVCAVTPGDVDRAGGSPAWKTLALGAGTVGGIFDDIRAVGRALGAETRADALIADMQQRIADVRAKVGTKRVPTIVVLEWTDPPFVMGNWGPELVVAAGGCPLLADDYARSATVDWDRVREADPDHLVIAPCGFSLERTRRELPALESLAGWSQLRAVREGRVALADGNRYSNRSGVTVVETVEILAEILHGTGSTHHGTGWETAAESKRALIDAAHAQARKAGADTYADPFTGYSVFTADYLLKKGPCCGQGCRHCPYRAASAEIVRASR